MPSGAISVRQAWVSVLVAAVVFVLAAGLLNPLCLALSPIALGWILLYSFAKRFTWWPHVWLGLSLAIAPVGGYLAVTGRWSRALVGPGGDYGRGSHLGGGLRYLLCPPR